MSNSGPGLPGITGVHWALLPRELWQDLAKAVQHSDDVDPTGDLYRRLLEIAPMGWIAPDEPDDPPDRPPLVTAY